MMKHFFRWTVESRWCLYCWDYISQNALCFSSTLYLFSVIFSFSPFTLEHKPPARFRRKSNPFCLVSVSISRPTWRQSDVSCQPIVNSRPLTLYLKLTEAEQIKLTFQTHLHSSLFDLKVKGQVPGSVHLHARVSLGKDRKVPTVS